MGKRYRNFAEYLQDNYYNQIFDKIKSYAIQNRKNMRFASYMVLDASYIELEDINVRGVTFHGDSNHNISFRVSVEASITLKGFGRKCYEADNCTQWFSVICYAHLMDGLHDFKIIDVEEYSQGRFVKEDALSQYLVPYLYAEKLDEEAEKFLQKYSSDALDGPKAIDIDEILFIMGINMYKAPLPNNIFGKSYFAEADVTVYDDDAGTSTHVQHLQRGDILINPNISFMQGVGSERNTIIHECVHNDRHDSFFEMQKLLGHVDADAVAIACEITDHYKPNRSDGMQDALHWMEWQANALTPHILVPTRTARPFLRDTLNALYLEQPESRPAEIMQQAIDILAERYQVSRVSAKIRAIEMGFDEAAGVYVYVDGKYLPPFSFKRGVLKKDQSYIVDEMNAIYATATVPELSELLYSGRIIYVNSMLCINDPKYVTENELGRAILTEYALENVDECCLVFDRKLRTNKDYDDSYYRICFLCREVNAKDFVEAKYDSDFADNQNKLDRARQMKKIVKEADRLATIMQELPGSFSRTLDYHIKRRKLSNEKLEERSGLSSRRINDLRNKEDTKKELTTVLALCIGMNLHPMLAEDLIIKAGHTWRPTEEHIMYRWLINEHSDENLDMWNLRLHEAGIQQRLPNNKYKQKEDDCLTM